MKLKIKVFPGRPSCLIPWYGRKENPPLIIHNVVSTTSSASGWQTVITASLLVKNKSVFFWNWRPFETQTSPCSRCLWPSPWWACSHFPASVSSFCRSFVFRRASMAPPGGWSTTATSPSSGSPRYPRTSPLIAPLRRVILQCLLPPGSSRFISEPHSQSEWKQQLSVQFLQQQLWFKRQDREGKHLHHHRPVPGTSFTRLGGCGLLGALQLMRESWCYHFAEHVLMYSSFHTGKPGGHQVL